MPDDGPDDVPMCRWPRVGVIPGARECLAALFGRVPLCVATNAAASTRSMVEQALDRVDLLRFIAELFCVADQGYRKSHPEFWRAVRRRLGEPLEQVVMIGDSLEHDVLAPRRFGLQTVWFNTRGTNFEAPPEVPTVTRLEELPTMIMAAR
jgi:FMN phosphatase YigB (HAD superfamily)